nr:MAG TPA: Protein of unknown function (DUF3683) [Bacteriophage sp.]
MVCHILCRELREAPYNFHSWEGRKRPPIFFTS